MALRINGYSDGAHSHTVTCTVSGLSRRQGG
jgi:hypothetical protein